ncbi:MAG: ATP-binding protein [Methanobrevibacter olleyae]|uniref:ATP-binding protein n=1 Tax=Methanobrevibacter olleyae TaxID=294671 RepID=A0A8T3VQC3_METOL|nr:ATP-binding protein [Methanobrevibacter olleyae]
MGVNMIPWGTRQKLNDDEFYNRVSELNQMNSLLNTTANGNAPHILLTGLRGVGKTVFLKKLKKDLEEDYLVVYLNFSRAECFQKGRMSVNGLMEFFFKEFLIEAKTRKLNTLDKKIEKFFKASDFKIKDFVQIDKIPIPIFGKETNTENLMDFVLTLPATIYEENKDKIKGILIFIDEFQIIKELDDYKEGFLWKLRSYIQDENYVSYTFSGSMSMQDGLISEIASQRGVFGGRMLTINLSPFTKDTVNKYLSKEAHDLIFTDDGFDRFYKCTSGIPAYVNIFATLLPKGIELNEEMIKSEFDDKIAIINSHLLTIWSKLTLREQLIIVALTDNDLKRGEIAKILGVTTGSISKPLINLQNQELIILENNRYHLNDLILKRWLELEYENKGTFPFRII